MTTVAGNPVAWADAVTVPSSKARDVTIDSMRGIAILMVIGIHSLPQPLASGWTIMLDAALRPCVPIFLFASGMMSAGKTHIPLGRRVMTAIVPYTIAFLAAYIYMALHNPNMDHRLHVTLARFGLAYVFVYYYVFVYVGCTVALWFVIKLAKLLGDSHDSLAMLLVLAIGFGLLTGAYLDPLLAKLGFSPSIIEEVRMRDIPFWFAFLALGLLAGTFRLNEILRDRKALLLAAAAIAYVIYTGVRLWKIGDDADYDSLAFFGHASLAALTLLTWRPASAALAMLGSGSYFIYLWHIFIIMFLRDHGVFDRFTPLAGFVFTFAATAILIAFFLVCVRRLAPGTMRRWVGA
ncbi:Fucose 4-O-acetylase [Afipia felis]|uniref:Fucose 4-O-acetylase n=2 Tax=Afipia felis TaxID=1035 RepID=A0A090N769_AFIFE|nr:Fucose 4-O-acetylase [Afipia felis]